MSVNGLGSYNSKTRISGLGSSGLDIDSLVSSLMKIEKLPVDKLGQKRQLNLWKQEAYRGVTTTLQGFKSDFFDVLKPANNMLSSSTYKKFIASALENGASSTVVSVSGSTDATLGSHTIVVNKMATADIARGTSVTKALQGSKVIADVEVAAMNGQKFNITIDGVTKEITIDSYATVDQLASGLQNSITTAFGQTTELRDKVNVTNAGGILSFTPNPPVVPNGPMVNRITLSTSGTDAGLTSIGFKNGDSNRLNTGFTLAQLASQFSTPLVFEGGTSAVTSSSNIADLNLNGKSFSMTVDGSTQTYTFTSNPTDVDDLASTLNTWASTSFGAGKVAITSVDTGTGKELSFTRGTSSYLTLNSVGSSTDALTKLNILTGSKASGELKFSINSKDFTFDASQSLTSLLNTINSDSDAKVNMNYDEASDKFTITAKQLGAGDNIRIVQNAGSGNLFSGASKIGTGSPVTTQGIDAEVNIDGQDLIRSTNNITVNGVTYNLLRANPGVTQNVSLSSDVDSVYNNIKNFVNKYNDVISTLNTKISEEYKKGYQPLTDDQKSAMTSEDITKWETIAKTGLLRNDSVIQNTLYNMRKALSDNVSGVNSSLGSIGITTGTYEEKGKLYIDDVKLKAAIQNDPDAVMNLFSKKSTVNYTDSTQRSLRFSEEGLAQRLNDVLQDNIRTSRDSSGNKGLLLEKAGIIGDASEFTNVLFKQIYADTQKISDLTSKLSDKESKFYARFTAMEQAITKMQNQSSQLLSKLG